MLEANGIIAVSSRGSDYRDIGVIHRVDQTLVSGLLEMDCDDRGVVHDHLSKAFRPVSENAVFVLAAQRTPQLSRWNERPNTLLQILPEALAVRTHCRNPISF
jgi:hypothetical protein